MKVDDEKDETKNLLYEPKDNIKESIKEPKIEEEKISDNKEKPKKIKKIKKKDVEKMLLGNSDNVENKISLNNKDYVKKDVIINLKDSVKSKYIKKIIFSFVNRNKILNIIQYNKYFQNILNIGIDNYKNKCNRYIIGERNGKGKEYYIDRKLVFEGEYLNGKKMEKEKNIMKMVN